MIPREQIFAEIADLMPELVPTPGMVAVTRLGKRAERDSEAGMLKDTESKCELLQAQVEELENQLGTADDTIANQVQRIYGLQGQVATQAEVIGELEYKLNEVSAITIKYGKALGEYQGKAERYRAAMLAVLGAGDLATAVEAVQEALGHDR